MDISNKNELYIYCDCHTLNHVLCIWYDEDTNHYFLSAGAEYSTFFDRCINSLKHIFFKQKIYVSALVINNDKLKQIKDFLYSTYLGDMRNIENNNKMFKADELNRQFELDINIFDEYDYETHTLDFVLFTYNNIFQRIYASLKYIFTHHYEYTYLVDKELDQQEIDLLCHKLKDI